MLEKSQESKIFYFSAHGSIFTPDSYRDHVLQKRFAIFFSRNIASRFTNKKPKICEANKQNKKK